MKDTPSGSAVRVFWLGGDRRLALRLLAGAPVEWVEDEALADLVLGERPQRAEAPGLTPRETEILGYLADGWSNAEMADRLGLTLRTVKFHLSGLFAKLGVSRRTEAIREAHNLGLIRY